jgi:hypothetical protein
MTTLERCLILGVFLLIIASTFIAAILVSLGFFERANPSLFKWLITFGIAEILGVVVWAFRETIRRPGSIAINIRFRGAEQQIDLGDPVDLDESKCQYEIWNGEATKLIKVGKLNITQEAPAGVWQANLPAGATSMDYVILRLVDKSGRRWAVRKFLPAVQTREARPET